MTLTELLIATTLLATATAGGLSGLSGAHAARRDAGVLQQMHERAQYVFATLEPELQMAGYFGTAAAPAALPVGDIPEPALRCGADAVRRLDLPVQSLPGWQLPCDARGGGAAAGSHVLVTRRLSARTAAGPEPGRAQWLGSVEGGRLYWNGEAPWSAATAGAGAGDGDGDALRELIVRIYYIARQSDGDAGLPALRMKSLTSIAGVPAFVDTEVMNGIESLRVEVLPSPAAPRALRVRLRVRADAGGVRAGEAPRTLDISRHFTLRNARD